MNEAPEWLGSPDRSLIDWYVAARRHFTHDECCGWILWALWFASRDMARRESGEVEFDQDLVIDLFTYGTLDSREQHLADAVNLDLLRGFEDIQFSEYFANGVGRSLFAPLALTQELSGTVVGSEDVTSVAAWAAETRPSIMTAFALCEGAIDLEEAAFQPRRVQALVAGLPAGRTLIRGVGALPLIALALPAQSIAPHGIYEDPAWSEMAGHLLSVLLAAGAGENAPSRWSAGLFGSGRAGDAHPDCPTGTAVEIAADLAMTRLTSGFRTVRVLTEASIEDGLEGLRGLARVLEHFPCERVEVLPSRDGSASELAITFGSERLDLVDFADARRDPPTEQILDTRREVLLQVARVLARYRASRNDDVGAVRLENVRAFASTVLPLAPLTLVYGPNAAGKSTVLSALRTVGRAGGRPGRTVPNPFAPREFARFTRGHDVDNGCLVGLLRGHLGEGDETEHSHEIVFGFGRDDVYTAVMVDGSTGVGDGSVSGRVSPRQLAGFFELDEKVEGALWRKAVAASAWQDYASSVRVADARPSEWTLHREALQRAIIQIDLDGEAFQLRDAADLNAPLLPASVAVVPGGEVALWRAVAFALTESKFGVDETLRTVRRLTSVPPVRPMLPRVIEIVDEDPVSRQWRTLTEDARMLERVNLWLGRLRIPYRLTVDPIRTPFARKPDHVAVGLIDERTGLGVAVDEVGYGVSQLLPVVIACIVDPAHLVLLEQPELHVHPAVQVELGDLLVEAIRPAGIEKQLIVETHSEHLLMRVQKRVRQGVLDPSLVRILYVDFRPGHAQPHVTSIGVDHDGSFTSEWPHGFFEERFDELFGDA